MTYNVFGGTFNLAQSNPYGQYISLKTSFHWLSADIVGSRSKWGLVKNMQKCNTVFDVLALSQQRAVMHNVVLS